MPRGMGTYIEDADAVAAVEAEKEVAGAFDTAFGLERDLQLALRRSLEQLEPGLTVMDGDREQTVASGPDRYHRPRPGRNNRRHWRAADP
jgi:hypothetical protein